MKTLAFAALVAVAAACAALVLHALEALPSPASFPDSACDRYKPEPVTLCWRIAT